MMAPRETAPALGLQGLAHGFFSRAGGVSTGLYATLNTGPGSRDDPSHVAENRARCARALGVAPANLATLYQVHSPDVVFVDGPFDTAEGPPRADAMVTERPGIALGVLSADCMPWLFVDPEAKIIAAAHGGWRGTLAGILENTVAAMVEKGAAPDRIRAAVGPCLRQPNFEVGEDLVSAFRERHDGVERFFAPGAAPDKRQFDLAGFASERLRACGVEAIDDIGLCTLGERSRYFSYRASGQAGESDYGRNLSAIALL